MKIEDEKKNFSLHTEFPGVSENNQVAVGMVDPQFNMTIYPKLALTQAVFFTGLGVSIKKYGFLSSSLIIWKKALDGRLLFGPGATLWSETPIIPVVLCSYFLMSHNWKWISTFLAHYCNPSFLAYSIIYDEDNDALLLHLADNAIFRPKSIFLKIENASKYEPNLAPDCQTHGLFGNTPSFSFDAPLGENPYRRQIFGRTLYYGYDAMDKRTLDLFERHIIVHIPHFLQIRDMSQAALRVPLLRFIRDRRAQRGETWKDRVWGTGLRSFKSS